MNNEQRQKNKASAAELARRITGGVIITAVIFAAMKLTGVTDWSWWALTAVWAALHATGFALMVITLLALSASKDPR